MNTDFEINLILHNSIKRLKDDIVAACRENGYISTMTGRRRYLRNINANQKSVARAAERQAINSTIQGSAADIVKCAMINIDQQFQKRYPSATLKDDELSKPMDFIGEKVPHLIMQIHDELLFEVPVAHQKEIKVSL